MVAGASDWGKEGAASQAKQVARLQRLEEARKQMSPRASRKNQPCPHLDLGPGKLISDFWPPVASHNTNVLPCPGGTVSLWEFYTSHRTLIRCPDILSPPRFLFQPREAGKEYE